MGQLAKTNQAPVSLKTMLASDQFKNRFQEILGKKAAGFISSIINVTNSDDKLKKADPKTIIGSAVVAATLDLPIDKNLGFSWIIGYNNNVGTKQSPQWVVQAQFQMGYKGFIQLALRTGQYHKLNVIEVYENQFKSFNAMTEELDADFNLQGNGNVVGYACYFRLVNGFEKTAYWSIEKVKQHGKRYSKNFNSGPWQTDFDAMAMKTVLKNTLSKWGIMSIEMQKATISDQAVINEDETVSEDYVDNYTEAEVVENETKTKVDEKVADINNQLKKVIDKKEKKEAKPTEEKKPEKLQFATESEARKFFETEMGIMPENLIGKKLFETAKELDTEFEIVPKDGKLL